MVNTSCATVVVSIEAVRAGGGDAKNEVAVALGGAGNLDADGGAGNLLVAAGGGDGRLLVKFAGGAMNEPLLLLDADPLLCVDPKAARGGDGKAGGDAKVADCDLGEIASLRLGGAGKKVPDDGAARLGMLFDVGAGVFGIGAGAYGV